MSDMRGAMNQMQGMASQFDPEMIKAVAELLDSLQSPVIDNKMALAKLKDKTAKYKQKPGGFGGKQPSPTSGGSLNHQGAKAAAEMRVLILFSAISSMLAVAARRPGATLNEIIMKLIMELQQFAQAAGATDDAIGLIAASNNGASSIKQLVTERKLKTAHPLDI